MARHPKYKKYKKKNISKNLQIKSNIIKKSFSLFIKSPEEVIF